MTTDNTTDAKALIIIALAAIAAFSIVCLGQWLMHRRYERLERLNQARLNELLRRKQAEQKWTDEELIKWTEGEWWF